MKHIQRIALANGEVEGIEMKSLAEARVNAAQIDHELTIDEHPHVVVTSECEGLASAVREIEVNLRSEEVVMHRAVDVGIALVVAEPVDRKIVVRCKRRDVRRRIERE